MKRLLDETEDAVVAFEPCNDNNSYVAIRVTCENEAVNGLDNLKKFITLHGGNFSKLVHTALSFKVDRRCYIFLFKTGGREFFTRLNLLDGVCVIGRYGLVPMPCSPYKTGMRTDFFELHGIDEDEIPEDFFSSLPEIPSWFDDLYELKSPFNDAYYGEVNNITVTRNAEQGFSGEHAKSQLIDALCRLRATGDDANTLKEVANACAENSGDALDKKTALLCAQYVYRRFRAVSQSAAPKVDPLAQALGSDDEGGASYGD